MWEIIRANRRKSFLLVIVMAALLLAVGYAAAEMIVGQGAGPLGLVLAFVIWIIMTGVAFFNGRSIFLGVSRAQKIKKEDHPRLFNVVEEMKIASQLPAMPDIYIIDDPSPNAFATGRKPENAAVAVTTGLLNQLNRDELQGVIAHEIGHIKNRDILFMTMIGVMMGAIVMIADVSLRTMFWTGGSRRSRTSSSGGGQAQVIIMVVGLVLMILSPILAQVIYMMASRKREYLADASSAQFTRYPEGLAGALEKISVSPVKMRHANKVTAPMFIINPLRKLKSGAAGLFSTHPNTLDRVKILRGMAGNADFSQYDESYRKVLQSKASVIPPSARKAEPVKTRPGGIFIPDGSLADSVTAPGAGAGGMILTGAMMAVAEPETQAGKARETTNAIWKARNYTFIDCECGAKLKVPAKFHKENIACLRCGRSHSLKSGS